MAEQPTRSAESRREEALRLAEETLGLFELGGDGSSLIRRAYRLGRLLDETEAVAWLRFEVVGYTPPPSTLSAEEWRAAVRSGRATTGGDGIWRADTTSIGALEARIGAASAQMAAAADAPVSVSSANPHQVVVPPIGNLVERTNLKDAITKDRALLSRVLGAVFDYVAQRHHELRFGSAVETAFEVVRGEVDGRISTLIPDAPMRLAAAFENAASANPEHWAGAAATCRRLLVAAADSLRPPGPDVGGRKMGPDNYVNRLVDWITTQEASSSMAGLVTADLEYLGRRLDAVVSAGSKGAHADVTRFEASRYITGTYLLLGDLVRLSPAQVGLGNS